MRLLLIAVLFGVLCVTGFPDVRAQDEQHPDKQTLEKPDVEKPDNEKPDNEKPDNEKPDNEKPDNEKPDVEKPDNERPDVEKPDDEKPDNQEPNPDSTSNGTENREKPEREKPVPADIPQQPYPGICAQHETSLQQAQDLMQRASEFRTHSNIETDLLSSNAFGNLANQLDIITLVLESGVEGTAAETPEVFGELNQIQLELDANKALINKRILGIGETYQTLAAPISDQLQKAAALGKRCFGAMESAGSMKSYGSRYSQSLQQQKELDAQYINLESSSVASETVSAASGSVQKHLDYIYRDLEKFV